MSFWSSLVSPRVRRAGGRRRAVGLAITLFPWFHVLPVSAEISLVGNAELRQLAAQGVAVVDVRTAGEWRQTGVVAGSQLITLFDETGQSDPAAWLQALDRVVPADRPVVLICRTGNRSGKAALLLEQRDPRRKIYNVRDGITGWQRAGEPVISLDRNLAGTGITCSPRC